MCADAAFTWKLIYVEKALLWPSCDLSIVSQCNILIQKQRSIFAKVQRRRSYGADMPKTFDAPFALTAEPSESAQAGPMTRHPNARAAASPLMPPLVRRIPISWN